MNLKKVAIITGASKGIGKATAYKFASQNYQLTVVATNQAELEAVAAELSGQFGTECMICSGDLADMDFLRSIIDKTVTRWGRVDVLVNNAAWRTIETMRTMDITVWEKTLRICLTAPAFLAKWCAARMEELHVAGSIINLSSIMSERAGGTSPAYISAKGAIESLTYELAVTYGRSGIRVLCVQPGYIETSLSNDYKTEEGQNISDEITTLVKDSTPLGRGGKAEEVAEAIYWLSSGEAGFITGTTLLIDGGLKHNFNNYSIKKLQFPREF